MGVFKHRAKHRYNRSAGTTDLHRFFASRHSGWGPLFCRTGSLFLESQGVVHSVRSLLYWPLSASVERRTSRSLQPSASWRRWRVGHMVILSLILTPDRGVQVYSSHGVRLLKSSTPRSIFAVCHTLSGSEARMGARFCLGCVLYIFLWFRPLLLLSGPPGLKTCQALTTFQLVGRLPPDPHAIWARWR